MRDIPQATYISFRYDATGYDIVVACPHCGSDHRHTWGGVRMCGKTGQEYEIGDPPADMAEAVAAARARLSAGNGG